MLVIGSHVSFNKDTQLVGSVEEALSYGSNTFMFYTGAPQSTQRSPISNELTMKAIKLMEENGIDYSKVIVHAPYIVNLANPDEMKREFAINFLKQETSRCDQLGVKYMVLHPGAHVGIGVEEGIKNIIDGLNKILENRKVMILLETMAGKGTEIGSNFNEIKSIIDGVIYKNNIGVCIDTCHLNDAGYDISKFDELLDEFDRIVGIDYIKCVHLNDSMNPREAHKDRHQNIGYGEIGFDSLINVCYNNKLESVPKILETPYVGDKAPYKYEIDNIKNKTFNDFKSIM